jgi:hypothetical protein
LKDIPQHFGSNICLNIVQAPNDMTDAVLSKILDTCIHSVEVKRSG